MLYVLLVDSDDVASVDVASDDVASVDAVSVDVASDELEVVDVVEVFVVIVDEESPLLDGWGVYVLDDPRYNLFSL